MSKYLNTSTGTSLHFLFYIANRLVAQSAMRTKVFRWVVQTIVTILVGGSIVYSEESPKLAEYRKAAEQGDAKAQLAVGIWYATEDGVPNRAVLAEKWFQKSADQGYVEAQFQLGLSYMYGSLIPKDEVKGVRWLRVAAEHGSAEAQHYLGVCYYNGQGIPKNDFEAVNWFRKAADGGYVEAQEFLGLCYAKGEGVDQNDVKAYMWFNISIAAGNTNAIIRRERMAQKMKPKQITKAQKLSEEWKPLNK